MPPEPDTAVTLPPYPYTEPPRRWPWAALHAVLWPTVAVWLAVLAKVIWVVWG